MAPAYRRISEPKAELYNVHATRYKREIFLDHCHGVHKSPAILELALTALQYENEAQSLCAR